MRLRCGHQASQKVFSADRHAFHHVSNGNPAKTAHHPSLSHLRHFTKQHRSIGPSKCDRLRRSADRFITAARAPPYTIRQTAVTDRQLATSAWRSQVRYATSRSCPDRADASLTSSGMALKKTACNVVVQVGLASQAAKPVDHFGGDAPSPGYRCTTILEVLM